MVTLASAAYTARAPGKVILFGEHAINRGQPALAASVGLYATCRLSHRERGFVFRSDAPGQAFASATQEDVATLAQRVEAARAAEDYEAIRRLSASDFFAPAKYIVASAFASCGVALPEGLEASFTCEIPPSCGLGSGGATFAALATALAAWLEGPGGGTPDRERIADWAHRGDVVAHGGVASRLDTQTSLCGGVIRFMAGGLGEAVSYDPTLTLVIGNTRVIAATSEVNSRVRQWLAANPQGRMRYFEAIGTLSRAALAPLEAGDWRHLGSLMTVNHVLLEKIGVSSPELEHLIDTALKAGALGAKVAGSGGGGIMVALVEPDEADAVATALALAGAVALRPRLAVPGARLLRGGGG